MEFSGVVLLLKFLSSAAAAAFKTPTSHKHIREELEVNNIRISAHWKQEVRIYK
jgi:hypothetical protein